MKNSAFVFLWILCSTGLCWSGCSDEKSTNVPKTEPEGFLEPSASKPGRLVTQAKACYFDEVDSIRKSINIELQVADTREKEIVDLMINGFSNKEIAAKLFISENTVETHRKNIYRKTEAHSITKLIQMVHDLNLLETI